MQRCSALASPPPAPGLEEAPAGALILRLGSRAMECHTIPGPASQERVPRGPVYGEQPTPKVRNASLLSPRLASSGSSAKEDPRRGDHLMSGV